MPWASWAPAQDTVPGPGHLDLPSQPPSHHESPRVSCLASLSSSSCDMGGVWGFLSLQDPSFLQSSAGAPANLRVTIP